MFDIKTPATNGATVIAANAGYATVNFSFLDAATKVCRENVASRIVIRAIVGWSIDKDGCALPICGVISERQHHRE